MIITKAYRLKYNKIYSHFKYYIKCDLIRQFNEGIASRLNVTFSNQDKQAKHKLVTRQLITAII